MSRPQAHVEIQARDIELLRDLFASRIMTIAHIAGLHFDGREEAAKKRIQKLKAAGYVAERPRKARDPSILFLTRSGFLLLENNGHLDAFPPLSTQAFERRAQVSELTIKHELAVMDVKAALMPAVNHKAGFKVVEFTTWPMLCEFDAQSPDHSTVCVKPDGLLRVDETTLTGEVYEHAFYIEVDRGTETLDTLARKASCYRHFYASGGFAEMCGGERAQYADYPFRVLVVLPSESRRGNLLERLLALSPPIETQVWVAITDDLCREPLSDVWVRPRDHRHHPSQAISPRCRLFDEH